MKMEKKKEEGEGNDKDTVRCTVKKERDDTHHPDPSCSSSSCSDGTDGGNTDSSAVAAKKEEREKETPQRPLQLVARSKATKLHHTPATSN